MKQLFMLCGIALLLTSCATGPSKSEKQSEIYQTAGAESLQKGEFTDALASLKEAVKINPKSAEAWSNMGLAYAGKEEYPRAESCFKKALELNPEFSDARMNLGALYLEEKKFSLAEKELRKVIEDLSYERSAQAKYNLGLVFLAQGKTLPAQQYFKLALKEDESYCPAWFSLAEIQRDRGELKEATKSYQNSVKGTCFRNPRAHFELSNLYLRAKENALAKSKLLEIIQFFPQTDWAQKAELTLTTIR